MPGVHEALGSITRQTDRYKQRERGVGGEEQGEGGREGEKQE